MKIVYLQASVVVVCIFLAEISCEQEERRPNLKTYPRNLTIQENGDAVFDCRDEGPLRAQVQWLRGKHVQESKRGRLIVRHVQVWHAGAFSCRAVGFSKTFPGAEVTVRLEVLKRGSGHNSCTPLEARCSNGGCVPKEFVCDGEFDCSDGSDELRCRPRPRPRPRTPGTRLPARTPSVAELRAPVACGKDEAPCRNGRCISMKLFCDGEFDCTDASDELHCNKPSQVRPPVAELRAPVACGKDEAPCSNGRCISMKLFCDGEFDCTDASDELHCNKPSHVRPPVAELRAPVACGKDEAPCSNGRCISMKLFCDGEFDCPDASDELHCNKPSRVRPPVAELRAPVACGKDEAPCRNGRCISMKFFCDGEFDCTDASDELHCNKSSQVRPPVAERKDPVACGKDELHCNRTSHHVTSGTRSQGAAESIDNEVVRPPKPRWSDWSPWSGCSARCERTRSRECGAAQRAADCEGEATQRQKCPMKDCQVDGSWSPWTAWTSCSESCGRGTRRRYRKCDSPAPNYGGAYCSGSDAQQENCMQGACASRGQWGPWGAWSTCSRGKNGTRVRRRVCEMGGTDCRGDDRQESACNPCPRNLKIGMKPVRLTVPLGRLVNLTCHYRRRSEDALSLQLDLPPVTHSNEVIKGRGRHIVIKDSLTATRCGARRRWTLLLTDEHTLVRCLVRDSEGRVLGKAESRVLSVTSNSVLCHGDKSCKTVVMPNKSWTKKLSSPSRNTKEAIEKDLPQKIPLRRFVSPPRILHVDPSFQIVHRGDSVHIACIAVGDPPLVVQWRADGRALAPRALVNGGVLHVRGIRVVDAGKYVCAARNSAGVAYSNANIVVT